MTILKSILGTALVLVLIPSLGLARSGSLTVGLSTEFDYDERTNTSNDEETTTADDDDYRTLVLRPLVQYVSASQRDRIELKANPGIKYDLIDDETDWDSDFYVGAERFMTKAWYINGSNHYLQSDYHDTETTDTDDAVAEPAAETTSPELSSDLGRSRYWQNTLNLATGYNYREDSLLRLSFDWDVLRNEDDASDSYEDYDRYNVSLKNEHRFTKVWKTTEEIAFVRGDYDKTDAETANAVVDALLPENNVTPIEDDLSNDLKEYYLTLAVENNSIDHNPLTLTYSYIGTKYDEVLRDDGDIHQMQLSWLNNISSKLYTRLGAGPSYEKTEGRDANWGGNGIAEINYLVQHGSFNFKLEKKYDVDNFSGTDERGFVDSWDAGLSFSYLLTKDLSVDGGLSYLYEDREDTITGIERAVSSGSTGSTTDETISDLEEYTTESYAANIGLAYSFLQHYSARASYTFTSQDSEKPGDDYDDHRILLTLSWKQELLHW